MPSYKHTNGKTETLFPPGIPPKRTNNYNYDFSQVSFIDSAKIYSKEIGKYPLLTKDQEIALAKRIKRGGSDGLEARNTLITSNLRLVIKMLFRYSGMGVTFQDLIEEGNLGLMKAARVFDWRRGVRFSTAAVWWIRQFMGRAISNQSRNIRLPVHVSDDFFKMVRSRKVLEGRLGRSPTPEEMSKESGLKPKYINKLARVGQDTWSLDYDLSGGVGKKVLKDILVTKEKGHDCDVLWGLSNEKFQELLLCLGEKERKVIELRYGFMGLKNLSSMVVSNYLGITRDRCDKLEATALIKLKDAMGKNKEAFKTLMAELPEYSS